jgi:hypothetical protein
LSNSIMRAGSQNPCANTLPLQYCSEAPEAMLAVAAIANFATFVKNIHDLIDTAHHNLDTASLADALTPSPPVRVLRNHVSTKDDGANIWTFRSQQSHPVPSLRSALGSALQAPRQLPTILRDGKFAIPIGDTSPGVYGDHGPLAAAFAAPIINHYLQNLRTVLVKASKSNLPEYPGTGDNFITQDRKWCDSERNMWTFLTLLDPLNSLDLQVSNITPPASGNLSQFGLSVEVLAGASNKSQTSDWANSTGPSVESFTSSVSSLNPNDIQLSDLIAFASPLCDLDQTSQFSVTQSSSCVVRLRPQPSALCP